MKAHYSHDIQHMMNVCKLLTPAGYCPSLTLRKTKIYDDIHRVHPVIGERGVYGFSVMHF